jgi:putative tryptophan/tyrosine transport system substrate-binding protein
LIAQNFITLQRSMLVVLLAVSFIAEAQQPKKIARIGYLGNTASTSAIDMKPFRERLRELGYIEGQNITIEYRYFDGKVERLPELAAELVRLNCAVIVAIGNEATGAAKNATKETPIIMASTNETVRSGFVASLARRWKHHWADFDGLRDTRETARSAQGNDS